MEFDRDFSEFLACCDAREVRYLVVGGYALAVHGHPRFTKDLDVWLWLDPGNADRVVQALEDFGFGSLGLTAADFEAEDAVVQLGRAPLRIDLLTSIDGVDFAYCWPDRMLLTVGERTVPFLSRRDLLANKRASGRLQDQADVEALTRGAVSDP